MLTHVNIQVTVQYMYMHIQGTMCLKKIFTDACSHSSVHTMFTYASGSVVHVDVDKLALCMHMQSTIPLKEQLTDACSHSSVHTLLTHKVTHGDMQVAV